MKNRLTKRILAAALCLVMLFTFTACDYENALALFDDTYAILPLRNTDDNPTFDEMVRSYVHYDYDAFLRYADKAEAAIRAGNEQKAEYMFNNLKAASKQVNTLKAITDAEYYSDLSNEFWANENVYSNVTASLVGKRLQELEALIDGKEPKVLQSDYAKMTREKNDLINEYVNSFNQNAYSEDPEVWEYYSNLLMKLVKLRNEEARAEGYANYAEAHFSDPYVIPFEKIKALGDVFAERASEFKRLNYAVSILKDLHKSEFEVIPTQEQLLSDFREFLPRVSGDMADALSDMEERGLLLFTDKEKAYWMCFSEKLTAYRTPFIFLCNYEDNLLGSYSTLVHEFGHAYAAKVSLAKGDEHGPYCEKDAASSESQSHGLEALFYASMDDNFEWVMPWEVYASEMFLLTVVVEECMVAELEQALYENEDMTPDELCRLYSDLRVKYGYDQSYEIPGPERYYYKYGFLVSGVLFTMPFYNLNYAPASFTAMQLMLMAEEDFEKAAKAYMTIENYGDAGNYGYEYIMRDAGLVDINDKAAVRAAVSDIYDYFNALLERTDYAEHEK